MSSLNRRTWNKKETATLSQLYPHYSTWELSEKLGRPYSSISNKAKTLHLLKTLATISKQRSRPFWTDEEIQTFKKLYPIKTDHELTLILKKSRPTLQRMKTKLGLKKSENYKKVITKKRLSSRKVAPMWTEEEEKKLRIMYLAGESMDNIMLALSRPEGGIYGKIKNLDLHRPMKTAKSKAYRLGKEGELIAEQVFIRKGWQIIEKGDNDTSYDFLIKNSEGSWAVNVKHGSKAPISRVNISRLFATPHKPAIVYITNEGIAYFMPIQRIIN